MSTAFWKQSETYELVERKTIMAKKLERRPQKRKRK